MKQCPSCSRTYANDKQKFCTQDGVALVDAHSASAGQGETVRIDSAELDDEITKAISKGLPRMTGSGFDPYKTTVSAPQETSAVPSQETETPRTPAPATPPPDQVAAPPPVVPPAPEPAVAPPPVTIVSSATNVPPDQVAAAAPVTPQVAPSAAAPVAPTSRPPKKRSKLPLILGILFVLLLLGAGGLVAGYFFVLKPMLEAKRGVIVEPRGPKPTPAVVTTPDAGETKSETPKIEVPPYSPPAHALQFVNSNANLTGKLAEHYVDFSFYYPDHWQKDPKAGVPGAGNFARVLRQLAPDAPQEIFAVGWYESTGSKDTDELSYPRLVEERSSQFAKDYPGYEKVSEGPTKAGPYDSYEFRFSAVYRNTERGDVKIWGRVMFVPPVEGKKGVTLLMLASSLATEVRGPSDVGVKGDLPMMLESFRFGK